MTERFRLRAGMFRMLSTLVAVGALAAPMALAASTSFVLDASASEARFLIGENLLGRETTAVGATQAVSGGLVLDLEDPSALAFEPFVVDVTTLRTDERQRDGQIQNRILQTNRAGNGTVMFQPSAVSGLEFPLTPGTTQSVQLSGELTIKGVTRQAVFELELTVVSATELTGTAATVVKLTDYELQVPRVPLVARVDDEVRLELDFRLLAR